MSVTEALNELRERIQHGIAWLDDQEPEWRERVDPDELDLQVTCDCILGQVFAEEGERHWSNGYSHTLERVVGPIVKDHVWDRSSYERRTAWAAAHGFELTPVDTDRGLNYATLTAEWKRVLA